MEQDRIEWMESNGIELNEWNGIEWNQVEWNVIESNRID
jgi:hypothetical protein